MKFAPPSPQLFPPINIDAGVRPRNAGDGAGGTGVGRGGGVVGTGVGLGVGVGATVGVGDGVDVGVGATVDVGGDAWVVGAAPPQEARKKQASTMLKTEIMTFIRRPWQMDENEGLAALGGNVKCSMSILSDRRNNDRKSL